MEGTLKLSTLSLADLVALHTNYFLSNNKGATFELLTQDQFYYVDREIKKRIKQIDFKN